MVVRAALVLAHQRVPLGHCLNFLRFLRPPLPQ
jgi:hypothetical protein